MKLTEDVVKWIKDYFDGNEEGKAVIGISGGKDSTVMAGLLVKAIGVDRVVCVLIPNGKQHDIKDSIRVVKTLNIPDENIMEVNIETAYKALLDGLGFETRFPMEPGMFTTCDFRPEAPYTVKTNLPSRLRMCVLYAVAAMYSNSRVVNTGNLSEDYIGYSTKFGDGAGDFAPLANLTCREVVEIGDDLGLPYDLVHKAPSDGMCGKTDEDNFGFTYEMLDNYLLKEGEQPSEEIVEKIERMHRNNLHKLLPMPKFEKNAKPGKVTFIPNRFSGTIPRDEVHYRAEAFVWRSGRRLSLETGKYIDE